MLPGGLHRQASDRSITCLRDRPTPLAFAARASARYQPEVGHQLTRGPEATEVVELGDQAHGRDGVDALEATQPSDRFAMGITPTELGQLQVELVLSLLQLANRQHAAIERRLARPIVEPAW